MNHLNDRRVCPGCGCELNERPYLMARRASANVLSLAQIAWVVVVALGLLAVVNV